MLKAEAADFAENIDDFAKKLAGLVAENGYLVSAERCDVDPVFLDGFRNSMKRPCRPSGMLSRNCL